MVGVFTDCLRPMTDFERDNDDLPTQDIELIHADGEAETTSLIIPDKHLPAHLSLLPIPNRPMFPGQVQALVLKRQPWSATLEKLSEEHTPFLGLLFCDEQDPEQLTPQAAPRFGCAVRILRARVEDEHLQLVVQGLKRFRIQQWLSETTPYAAEVDYPPTAGDRNSDEVRAYALAIINAIKELLPLNPLYGEELKQYLGHFSPEKPSQLTDFAAALTSAKGPELQAVLETLPLLPRMEKVLLLLKKEREVAELQSRIREQVQDKMSERQREFFLREQLKVIQRELGIVKDDRQSDAETFRQRLEGKTLPAAAQKRIDDELHKLSILETSSPEYGVTRNYLDWATQLPWGVYSEDQLDVPRARKILDRQHDGLDDVKDRITEWLALGQFKGGISGSIILLVGPPGVGKTSIGKSIAEALGRKFYRFSLGGMRDEAEIKGHRRTYIGAMPGKLVQALKEVETANPVIMLDEIDKLGASYQGDPASALLEVLDPEQNVDFLDHYLDLRVDLSQVLFVCTANQLDSIPAPLLDRMEVIRLAGYITEEKLAIARHHLWPRLLERNRMPKSRLQIGEKALRVLIEGYAREAGVRNLEKQLAALVRKSAVKLLADPALKLKLGPTEVQDMLGKPLFQPEQPGHAVGVVTGLAWTAMGGATLPVECSRIHTLTRGFKLTGKLGEVMKESAEIAYSYAMAHLGQYGADQKFFDESMIHLHVPEGATPKDGPSAGITMTTALLSLALNRPLNQPVAMTGEITLAGKVLAVGGIREKVIAARRAGIRQLVMPEANRKDFEELPDYLQKGLTVRFAEHYNQVFAWLLAPQDAKPPKAKSSNAKGVTSKGKQAKALKKARSASKAEPVSQPKRPAKANTTGKGAGKK